MGKFAKGKSCEKSGTMGKKNGKSLGLGKPLQHKINLNAAQNREKRLRGVINYCTSKGTIGNQKARTRATNIEGKKNKNAGKG